MSLDDLLMAQHVSLLSIFPFDMIPGLSRYLLKLTTSLVLLILLFTVHPLNSKKRGVAEEGCSGGWSLKLGVSMARYSEGESGWS